jgi:hypothetical protein
MGQQPFIIEVTLSDYSYFWSTFYLEVLCPIFDDSMHRFATGNKV